MTEAAGKAIFVTGTDTEVGKTYVTTRLIEALRSSGLATAGFKPIECGGRDDALAIHRAMGGEGLSLEQINPINLEQPLAPVSADYSPEIDLDILGDHMTEFRTQFDVVLVEGIGGWLAPIDAECSLADFAGKWKMNVLLVAANRLGVLNHCLLTLESLESRGCSCCGILLNDLPDPKEGDESLDRNANALRMIRPDLPVNRTAGIDWRSYAQDLMKSC